MRVFTIFRRNLFRSPRGIPAIVALVLLLLAAGCYRKEEPAKTSAAQKVESPEKEVAAEKAQTEALRTVVDPANEEIRKLRRETATAFEAEQFDELEKTAAWLRLNRETFSNGLWKIAQFYDAFSGDDRQPDTAWQERKARHDRWIAAQPESITARIAYAVFLTGYAWYARGSGYANTVAPEGWRSFNDRLMAARAQLEAAQKLPTKDIYLWRAASTVALGQGWEPEEYDRLPEESYAAEPEFWGTDLARAYSLLPRWYGQPGDWEAFAEKAAARPKGLGAELYARIATQMSGYYEDMFRETHVSWPKMREGFDALRKKYPASREFLSQAAFFAVCARDREYAQAAFEKLGEQYVRQVWPSREAFVHCRNWARTGQW